MNYTVSIGRRNIDLVVQYLISTSGSISLVKFWSVVKMLPIWLLQFLLYSFKVEEIPKFKRHFCSQNHAGRSNNYDIHYRYWHQTAKSYIGWKLFYVDHIQVLNQTVKYNQQSFVICHKLMIFFLSWQVGAGWIGKCKYFMLQDWSWFCIWHQDYKSSLDLTCMLKTCLTQARRRIKV